MMSPFIDVPPSQTWKTIQNKGFLTIDFRASIWKASDKALQMGVTNQSPQSKAHSAPLNVFSQVVGSSNPNWTPSPHALWGQ
jgi:hypothetical protein